MIKVAGKLIKLEIELVPRPLWFANLRKILLPGEWQAVKKETYRAYSYLCGICGGRGSAHPVEAHEIWHYNDKQRVQTLLGTIALCPTCHEVKHYGLALSSGREDIVFPHLMKVNRLNEQEANAYIKYAFQLWETRSAWKNWQADYSWIEKRGYKLLDKYKQFAFKRELETTEVI